MEKIKEEKISEKSPMLDHPSPSAKPSSKKQKKTKAKNSKYRPYQDPFYRSLFGRLNTKKEREKIRSDLGKLMEMPSYTFRLCPWYLWGTSFILLAFDILLTFVLFHVYESTAYYKFVIGINILFYYLSFVLLYTGEIEYFEINRQKGFVKKSKVNIFCSRRDRVEYFNDIDYCQMIMKGTKKGANDNRKYFMRMYMKDTTIKPIEWGYTWNFDSISFKYQVCLAMIKGLVIEKVEEYLIKDEAYYPDFMY